MFLRFTIFQVETLCDHQGLAFAQDLFSFNACFTGGTAAERLLQMPSCERYALPSEDPKKPSLCSVDGLCPVIFGAMEQRLASWHKALRDAEADLKDCLQEPTVLVMIPKPSEEDSGQGFLGLQELASSQQTKLEKALSEASAKKAWPSLL